MESEILTKLKEAELLKVPVRFISQGENLITLVAQEIADGKSLPELSELFPTLYTQDLAVLYAYYLSKYPKEEVLNAVNEWLETLEKKAFRDTLELNLLVKKFQDNLAKEFQQDMAKLENIEALQEELDNQPALPHSTFKVQSTTLTASLDTNKDAYQLFRDSNVTKVAPYLHWRSGLIETPDLYKIYKGTTLEERPEISKIQVDSKNQNETFLFTIDPDLKGSYNFPKNSVKVKLPVSERKDQVIENIENLFGDKLINPSETELSGTAYIFGVDVDMLLLSHMILNYEVFNTFLFTRDTLSNLTEAKKSTKIYYKTGALDGDEGDNISISLRQLYARGDENYQLPDGDNYTLRNGTPYLQVKVSGANDLRVVEQIFDLLSRLFTVYQTEFTELEKLYLEFIPEFSQLQITETEVGGERDSKIARLKQAAPDLFIADYARKCLCPFQPIVVPDDEIEAWEAKTFIYNGRERKRQVMRFPPGSKNPVNFVCPEDRYPFPGVKTNTLANRDKYLGLPCCFANDQIGPAATSKYNKFYRGQKQEKAEVGHLVKSDKILEPGRYGLLPNSITELLSRVTTREIRRRGVERSPNSLLHCIAIATEDKKYLDLANDKREAYIIKLRKSIAKKVLPGLLKQELYDFTDQEIQEALLTGFFDPDLYFRAVEQIYKINLFVFAPSDNEVKRLANKEDSVGVLQLPRYKLFHARTPHPKRPAVCIYRTLGSERDSLEYPQCELIVFRKDDKDRGLMGKTVYNFLTETLLNTYQTVSWELVQTQEGIDTLARKNLYSQIDFLKLFPKATAQFIDVYGKLRGLYLPVDGEEMMISVVPSAPVNLPVRQDIVKIGSEKVQKIITNPTAVSPDGEGLWFSILDLPYGLFVPIVPDKNINLPVGPVSPLEVGKENVVPRIYKLQRDLNYLVQTFRWLYSLSDLTLDQFIEKYVGVDREIVNVDSATIYDFTDIGRYFPQVDRVEEGIKEMAKRVPTLFSENRIYLYSEKLFSGLYYLTQKYLHERVTGRLIVSNSIVTQPLLPSDFPTVPGVSVFLSEKELDEWSKVKPDLAKILTEISEKDSYRVEPYLYQASDGHIYMIQNVSGAKLENALTVSKYWWDHRVNPGFNVPEKIIADKSYVVYGITATKELVPIENTAGQSLEFYSLIQYNPRSYGAMLRLL